MGSVHKSLAGAELADSQAPPLSSFQNFAGLGAGCVHYINVQWLQGGLVFKAHRPLYHSTLDMSEIQKGKKGSVHKSLAGGVRAFLREDPRHRPRSRAQEINF